MATKNIIAYFDIQGFWLDDHPQHFVVKEYALVDGAQSYHGLVDHGFCKLDIPKTDRWSVSVQERDCIGMSWRPNTGEMYLAELEDFLKDYYATNKSPTEFLIGFTNKQAGTMLQDLSIPFVQVEKGYVNSHCHLHKQAPKQGEIKFYFCALQNARALYVKHKK